MAKLKADLIDPPAPVIKNTRAGADRAGGDATPVGTPASSTSAASSSKSSTPTQAEVDAAAKQHQADLDAAKKKADDEAIANGTMGSGPNGTFVPGDPGYKGGNNNGGGSGGGVPGRKAVSTQMINRGGDQIMITTYDDGTTSEQNYGVDPAVTAQKQNWRAVGQSLLDKYGIGSLGSQYFSFLDKGYDSQTALLALQSTPEWEQRFSANKARLAKGLPVLDPATYLATEESYKDVMINAGVDKSVYNDPLALGKIMSQDVSPVEMKQRLDAAQFELDNKDPFVTAQLQQRFGLTNGDMMLHILDPSIAAPIIAQKVQSAKIGAEAARQGLNATTGQADALAAQGITQSQAAQGFGNIGQMQEFGQNLPGDISGSLTQQQLINAQFGVNAPDQLALKNLQARRLSDYNQSGQLAQDSKGVSGAGVSNSAT